VRPRRGYLQGLLTTTVSRKNGWQLTETLGERRPGRVQGCSIQRVGTPRRRARYCCGANAPRRRPSSPSRIGDDGIRRMSGRVIIERVGLGRRENVRL